MEFKKSTVIVILTILLGTVPVKDAADTLLVDDWYSRMDATLQDITEKYRDLQADSFWHPYVFGTGNINREVIKIENLNQQHIPGNFIQWKVSKLGLKQHIVGLTKSSVEIFDSRLQLTTKKDFGGIAKAMETVTRWDSEHNEPMMIVFVATSEPSLVVLKSTGQNVEEIGSFPLHSSVKSVTLCRVNNNDKIMLVPDTSDSPITLYNIDISSDGAQLWYFQRLTEPLFTTAIVHQPDTQDSLLIVSHNDHINIYVFDAELGQFSVQQTLPLQKCSNMYPFTLMYQHYIACVGGAQSTQFITYDYNTNEYETKGSIHDIEAMDMFPITIEGSRDDAIIIRRNTNGIVDILTYNGREKFEVGHECTLDACTAATNFVNGASFVFEDTTAYILPTPAGQTSTGAPVIVLFTDVLATVSPVLEQSLGLFSEFSKISQQWSSWKNVVNDAERTLANQLNTEGDNIITGDWNVKNIATQNVDLEDRVANSEAVFNVLKFGNVQWTEEDFISTNDEIITKMGIMDVTMALIINQLDDALMKGALEEQVVTSTTLVQGSISASNFDANTLNVDTIWGENTAEFLDSLALKNRDIKVAGDLIFNEQSTINHLQTTKINDVITANLARLSSDNVFQCSYHFENIQTIGSVDVSTVNGHNLLESVVMMDAIAGFHFIDGMVAYRGAETMGQQYPFDDVLLSTVPQTVRSPVAFDEVDITAPVSVGLLKGKDFSTFVSNVVTKHNEGKITGTKVLENPAGVLTFHLTNTWNELQFPSAFFSSSTPSIKLAGTKSFTKIIANEVTVEDEVDGVNTNHVVSLSEPETIDSVWTFNGRTKIMEDIEVSGTVDGIFMESLLHMGMLHEKHDQYKPNADLVFDESIQVEDLNVAATINGKQFEDLFDRLILFDGTECLIPGLTTIAGDVVFNDLKLQNDKINGFSIENFLTKNTPQVIANPVTFTEEASFVGIHSLDHFDGVRVKDVLEQALRVSASTATMIPWNVHFENIECLNNLRVDGLINGRPNFGLSAARTRGLSTQTFAGPIVANAPIFKTLSTANLMLDEGHTLQTLDIKNWNITRVKLSEATTFSQPLFANRVTVQADIETSVVNGINVDDLHTKVFRTDLKFQEFSSPMNIMRGLHVQGDVQFHKTLDGVLLQDIINNGFPLKSDNEAPIVISHNWEFESLKMTTGITTNGRICGVDLDFLQSDAIKKDETNVQVLGGKSFAQPLQIVGSIKSPHINNMEFLRNLFFLEEDQEISSPVVFTSSVSGDMMDLDSINNVPVSWLSQKYSFHDGTHVLNHNLFINDGLVSNTMTVDGKIQDENLEEFLSTAFKITDDNIKFQENVELENSASFDNNIQTVIYNGINFDDLTTKMILLHEDLTLERPVTFANTLQVEEMLSLNENLDFVKLVDGIDWNELTNNAVFINDPNNELDFPNIQFEHLVVSNPITLSSLNGRPFDDYATLNSLQDLGSWKISKVILNSSNVDIRGLMGHSDISEEYKDTLMMNLQEPQFITGMKTIQGPTRIKQDLNCFGSNFKDDIITTREDFELTGPVEFTEPIFAESNVQVSQPMQGHTVESIFSNLLTTDTEQKITENWDFRGPVTFKQNVSGQGLSGKLDVQALVQEKDEELRAARDKVNDERQSFIRRCQSVQIIKSNLAQSPMKLDSFESHQIIALQNEGSNILTVGDSDNVMLLVQTSNCDLTRYKWQAQNELFHKVIENLPPIGSVDSWQSVSHNAENTVVFSTSPSDCSIKSGLHFIQLSLTTDLSTMTVNTVSDNEVKSFKVVVDEVDDTVVLFVLFQHASDELAIFRLDNNQFNLDGTLQLGHSMERLDVTVTSRGFSILCHNKGSVYGYEYSATGKMGIQEAVGSIVASSIAPLTVFESFDLMYALVPESGTSPSLIQPTCNFQLLRFAEGSVDTIQKIAVPEVISATYFKFSKNHFVGFLSRSHGLIVQKFMGLNGFESIGASFKVFGGLSLKSFSVRTSGFDAPRPFILMLTPNAIEIFRGNVFGDTFSMDFDTLCSI